MITALVLTVALGQVESQLFGYYYPNEQACNSAKNLAIVKSTGKHTVTLECHPGYALGGQSLPFKDWRILSVGVIQNTVRLAGDPQWGMTFPDSTSCSATLTRLNHRSATLAGRQFINLCLPKAQE